MAVYQEGIIVLALLCWLPSAVRADMLPELSWEDCVQEAVRNHPDLAAAREKLNQNKAQKDITRAGALPQLNSSLSASRSNSTGKSQTRTYAHEVTGKQLLFDAFKTSNDIAAAQEDVRAAKYNYQVVSSNVRLRLWTAFIDLLSAQESLKVVEGIAQRRRQSLDLIFLRYQGGREHKGSLLTAQANLAQADFDVQQAKRNVDLSQRRLSKELGRAEFMPMAAKGALETKDFDPVPPDFEQLVGTVPFLKELAAQKEAARFGVQSARSDFFPRVYVNAGAGKTDSSWPPGRNEWSAGLSLTFPLFEGGAQQAQLSKARSAFNASRAEEQSGRDGMILTLAGTWTQWQDDASHVDVQKKFLEASQVRGKIAEAQYSTGLISFNDWIIIEDDLVKNEKAFVQAKTNALISEADWLQAKGQTLDD